MASCLTFLSCSDGSLLKPFFVKCGDVIDPVRPWSANAKDLNLLTTNQLKALLPEKALVELTPKKKEDFVNGVMMKWQDVILTKTETAGSFGDSGGSGGEDRKDKDERPPDDTERGGDSGGDDDEEPESGDFSDFDSVSEEFITVYVDTRTMLNNHFNPSFQVKTTWPVRYLKLALFWKFGIPPNVQRLMRTSGSSIYDQRSFTDNNIHDGVTIVLTTFGDGGVKRTLVKEKDESKILRLKQRVRSDVRVVEVSELDNLIAVLEELKVYVQDEFTVQGLLGDADTGTLRHILDLIPTGLSGKASSTRMANIIHKLMPSLKSLHEDGLTVCKDTYQYIYHNFMTQYAEQFNSINVSDATLNHQAFKDSVQGLLDIKTSIEKQDIKEETKLQFEEMMKQEVARIRQEEAQKASVMAKQMAEDFIKSQSTKSGAVPTPMEEG